MGPPGRGAPVVLPLSHAAATSRLLTGRAACAAARTVQPIRSGNRRAPRRLGGCCEENVATHLRPCRATAAVFDGRRAAFRRARTPDRRTTATPARLPSQSPRGNSSLDVTGDIKALATLSTKRRSMPELRRLL